MLVALHEHVPDLEEVAGELVELEYEVGADVWLLGVEVEEVDDVDFGLVLVVFGLFVGVERLGVGRDVRGDGDVAELGPDLGVPDALRDDLLVVLEEALVAVAEGLGVEAVEGEEGVLGDWKVRVDWLQLLVTLRMYVSNCSGESGW